MQTASKQNNQMESMHFKMMDEAVIRNIPMVTLLRDPVELFLSWFSFNYFYEDNFRDEKLLHSALIALLRIEYMRNLQVGFLVGKRQELFASSAGQQCPHNTPRHLLATCRIHGQVPVTEADLNEL